MATRSRTIVAVVLLLAFPSALVVVQQIDLVRRTSLFEFTKQDEQALLGAFLNASPQALRDSATAAPKNQEQKDPDAESTTLNVEPLKCLDLTNLCSKADKEEFVPNVQSPPSSSSSGTLALGCPVLKGGYRNQYMRFVALVAKAIELDYSILLPSIKWHEKSSSFGVPFELLWDVDFWNTHPNLPKLVPYHPGQHSQWNPNTTTYYGLCPTVVEWFRKPHKTNTYQPIESSNHPYVFGGASSGARGSLWDLYRRSDKLGRPLKFANQTAFPLQQLEDWIVQAMRPSRLVQSLVKDIRPGGDTPYLAVHPRVEPEMLYHGHCLQHKVRNLTEILDMVLSHPDLHGYHQMFVALAMPQMRQKFRRRFQHFEHHEHNLQVIENALQRGHVARPDDQKVHLWMAGEEALVDRNVNSCMMTLLASIVNLELAVQANVFVGTKISTWSISVWKIRHALNKPNYEFTPNDGVRLVQGLPEPFNC